MAATVKEYFEDSHRFQSQSVVVSCTPSTVEGETGVCNLVLESTIMHPQGGGQPADVGVISSDTSSFEVSFAGIDKETGVISHKGKYANGGCFTPGVVVTINVDEPKRRLNARLHSAGHLLDSAVKNIGWDSLVPSKGNHFIENLFVEYVGKIEPTMREKFIADINVEMKQLIFKDTETVIRYETPAGAPSVRIMSIGGVECPCGGTHVKSTKEIGCVEVYRVKANKKNVKVYYKLV
eukprot:CFRG7563T1